MVNNSNFIELFFWFSKSLNNLVNNLVNRFTKFTPIMIFLLLNILFLFTIKVTATPLVAYEYNKEWFFLSDNKDTLFKKNDVSEVFGYSEGIYTVKLNTGEKDQWSALDENGNKLFSVSYDEMGVFHNGYAIVSNYLNAEKKDKIFGFIDKKGKLVLPLEYIDAIPFSEGMAYVMKEGKRGYVANHLDKNGNLEFVISLIGNKVGYNFSEGLAAVSNDDYEVGYIDKQGKLVINYRFDEPAEFSEGKAKVTLAGKFGFIDTNGEFVITLAYDEARNIKENRTFLAKNSDENGNPKWALTDGDGNKITDFIFDYCREFSNGFGLVKLQGNYGFIDGEGQFTISEILTNANSFNQLGYAFACNTNIEKIGFLNKQGQYYITLPNFTKGIDLVSNQTIDVR